MPPSKPRFTLDDVGFGGIAALTLIGFPILCIPVAIIVAIVMRCV